MDLSIGLGQAVAATAVLLLGRGRSGEPGRSVYALAAGRLLLRVRLAGEGASPEMPGAVPLRAANPGLQAEVATYLAPRWTGFESSEVRLVPSARTQIRRASEAVVGGFEQPLVRPMAAMVASGVLSFAVAALTLGGTPRDRAELPVGTERAAEIRYEDPSRWERDLLLADVGAPAPHTFKRTSGHTNVVIAHTNNMTPHANIASSHTNVAATPHSNSDPPYDFSPPLEEHKSP